MHRYHFTNEIYGTKSILSVIDFRVFNKMRSNTYCINSLSCCNKSTVYDLGDREHHYELPTWQFSFFQNSFVKRCVYNYK